jgi:hypothetical protein
VPCARKSKPKKPQDLRNKLQFLGYLDSGGFPMVYGETLSFFLAIEGETKRLGFWGKIFEAYIQSIKKYKKNKSLKRVFLNFLNFLRKCSFVFRS